MKTIIGRSPSSTAHEETGYLLGNNYNYRITYRWAKNLAEYAKTGDGDNPYLSYDRLSEFDDSNLYEGKRLNIMLAAILWKTKHDCVHKPFKNELYLYYE